MNSIVEKIRLKFKGGRLARTFARLFFIFFFFALISLISQSPIHAATLYWVGNDGASASVASNWKTTNPTTCGSGDSLVAPVAGDTLNFDVDCDNGALIDSGFTPTVSVITISSGYAGTITLSNPLTVSSTFTQSDGIWDSSNQNLIITSTFTLNNGAATFKASSGTTTFSGTFNITAGTFTHNSGIVDFSGGASSINCNGQTFNLVNFNGQTATKTIGGTSNCVLPLGTNPIIPNSITLGNGTLSGSGTLTETNGTLTIQNGAQLLGFTGLVVNSLTLSASTSNNSLDLSNYTTVDINSNFVLSFPTNPFINTFIAPSGTMTVGGNFTINGGSFNHNNGTVELDGISSNHTISGSNTFYNLKSNTPTSRAILFGVGTTQTILGTLTLQGSSGTLLRLESSTLGTQWNINPQGTRNISYISVKDGNNTNITPIEVGMGSLDIGNNVGWTFPASNLVTLTGITYTSTLDNLSLKMDIAYDNSISNAPILLELDGYSGPSSGDSIIQRFAKKGLFAIKTYKRSYGGSVGIPDDSGREIYDFYDAIEYVKANYPQYVDPTNTNVVGYSGGGGNVYGLITKFPDYFSTAQVFFGMSDYGYDDTYGWWNNGANSGYRTTMQNRIGGSPTDVRDNYYSRAHYLGVKNNPYSYIQLFYDSAESVVPVSHGTQYADNALNAGLSNVTTRTSDTNTTVNELNEPFSNSLVDWLYISDGNTMITRNSLGYLDLASRNGGIFDVAYKKLGSLRNYGKEDHIKASFDFKIDSAEDTSTVLFSLRDSGSTVLRNSISTLLLHSGGVIRIYLRADYNGAAFDSSNRTLQIFTTTISTGTSYHMDFELDNGVVTGILKDSDLNTLETQTLTLDVSKTFDGVDSFGISNFINAGTQQMLGTVDNISVISWARWIHGYPQEGAGTPEGDITAENYFIPNIIAGTYTQPTLNNSGTMFIPGYIKTNEFFIMLGTGNNEAGNLSYNVTGDATSLATAKSFTIEGLTGLATTNLNVYGLLANTQYYIKDSNLTDSGSILSTATTDAQGILTYSGNLGSTHMYEVFQDIAAPTGGSIVYTDGYYTGTTVSLTLNDGTDPSMGVDISSRIIQRSEATLTGGTCGSYGSFATITPTGTYPSFTDSTVVSGNCYQYQYLVSDNASNQATYTSSNVVKVDTSLPSTPGIPSTTSPTNDTTPTWNWTASGDTISGIDHYVFQWCTDSGFSGCGANIVNAASNSYTHTSGLTNGTWYVRVKAVDLAGNESSHSSSGSVVINTTAPIGSVVINSGATFINNTSVTLTLSVVDDLDSSGWLQMKVSNDSNFVGASYESYAASKSWTLSSGADGVRTVYVMYKDTTGNESDVYSDTINFDTTAPIIKVTNLGLIFNVPDQTNLAYYFTSQTPYIQGVTEVNSIVHFKYNGHNYTTTAGTDGKYAISISSPDLPRTMVTLTYYSIDQAGNKSAERTLTLIIGVENFPPGIISTPSDTTTTPTPTITKLPNTGETTQTPVIPMITTLKVEDQKGKQLINATITIDVQKYVSDYKGEIYVEGTPNSNSKITAEYNGKNYPAILNGDKIVLNTTDNSFNMWPIILTVIIIAGLGGGGYFYWKKHQKS